MNTNPLKKLVHNKDRIKKIVLPIILFSFAFLIYLITSGGETPYNYFTRLGHSFISGKYFLNENPPWLNELIPLGENKFAVPYPPMPAILSIPFVAIFGKNFPQQILAHILGSAISVVTFYITLNITKNKTKSLWVYLFCSLGNILWYLSSVGSSWYLGQISGAFFISLAIYESLKNKRPFLVGVLLGCAYLSRIHLILSVPFFIFLLYKKDEYKFKNIILLISGCFIFIGLNSIYNLIRFGVIWDKSYLLIPGVLDEPWFAHGILNIRYIFNNIKTIFWSFPKKIDTFPYIIPSWNGLSIWITSPAFLLIILSPLKNKITQISYIAALPILFFVFMHGSNGFAQFGYRFAVDAYPFLFLILINSLKERRLNKIDWFLLIISIIVNLWGVVWINKFGWVTF